MRCTSASAFQVFRLNDASRPFCGYRRLLCVCVCLCVFLRVYFFFGAYWR